VIFRIFPVVLGAACVANAQDAEGGKKLEFGVASVRIEVVDRSSLTPHPCLTPPACENLPSRIQGGPGTSDPGRMTFPKFSMMSLLMVAFSARDGDQISAPDSIEKWLRANTLTGAHYDIVAKVPSGTTKAETNEMLKNLLIDRFGLSYHMEKRELDGYRMTIAKGGPKLKPAAPADGPQWIRPYGMRQPSDDEGFPTLQPGYPSITYLSQGGVVRLAGRMVTTEDLLQTLRIQLGGPSRLLDQTGLTDKYDLRLEFANRVGPGTGGAPADAASEPAADLFTALEKQLGLKLEPVKVTIDAVVIDHLNEQPSDN
jgi:uncharacterized protein (TIGR03435 family)